MRLTHPTPAELHIFIAKARSEMVKHQSSGDALLAEFAEKRMNRWLDQLAKLSGVSAA